MIKLIVSIALVMICTSSVWATVERQDVTETVSSQNLYQTVTATFNLSGKVLVNEEVNANGLDDTYGISVENRSFCRGNTPYGSTLCTPSTYVNSVVVDGDELTVEVVIAASSNPYALVYIMDYSVQISYTEASVYNVETNVITLELPETQWADIHLDINGQLLNYRMNKSGDLFSKEINVPVAEGDILTYWLTAQADNGAVYETELESVVVPELPTLPEEPAFIEIGYANEQITTTTLSDIQWVVAHYSVNGVAYENVIMQGAGTEWAINVTLNAGDGVEYFFTYAKDGIATDTEKGIYQN